MTGKKNGQKIIFYMSWCSPSNTPRFYDYTQIASLWSRLSACKLTRENSELVHNEISKIVLTLSQDTDRPLTVHGWKETVCASLYFLEKIRNIIIYNIIFKCFWVLYLRRRVSNNLCEQYECQSSPNFYLVPWVISLSL